jgi:hypothetical protein
MGATNDKPIYIDPNVPVRGLPAPSRYRVMTAQAMRSPASPAGSCSHLPLNAASGPIIRIDQTSSAFQHAAELVGHDACVRSAFNIVATRLEVVGYRLEAIGGIALADYADVECMGARRQVAQLGFYRTSASALPFRSADLFTFCIQTASVRYTCLLCCSRHRKTNQSCCSEQPFRPFSRPQHRSCLRTGRNSRIGR